MSLIRWSPFFEPFESFDKYFEGLAPASSEGNLIPAINMYDTKDGLAVETSLPGVDPKKVELSIENGVLTIKGSSERKTEVDEKEYFRREIRSGTFMRQVTLPQGMKEDDATATFENGILKVTFPKAKLPEPKKIQIDLKTDNS